MFAELAGGSADGGKMPVASLKIPAIHATMLVYVDSTAA